VGEDLERGARLRTRPETGDRFADSSERLSAPVRQGRERVAQERKSGVTS